MMKKYFNFAFLSAIALVGTLGFTACSSTDDTVACVQRVEWQFVNNAYVRRCHSGIIQLSCRTIPWH